MDQFQQLGDAVGNVVDDIEVGRLRCREGLGFFYRQGKLIGIAPAHIGHAANQSVHGVFDLGGQGRGQFLAAYGYGRSGADARTGCHGRKLTGSRDEGACRAGNCAGGVDVDDGGDAVFQQGLDDVLGRGEVTAGSVQLEDNDFRAFLGPFVEYPFDKALCNRVDVAVDVGDKDVTFLLLLR